MFQTGGFTPLYIASETGHVECVRTLLGGGAAINQAMVGCASSKARDWGLRARSLRVCMRSWLGRLGCGAVEGSGE